MRDDYSVGYSKKGGFKTAKETRASYQRILKEFDAKRKGISYINSADILLLDYLKYWFYDIYVHTIETSTRMVYEYMLTGYILPDLGDIKLRSRDSNYFDALLLKISKQTQSSGNKSRELLNIAMKNV